MYAASRWRGFCDGGRRRGPRGSSGRRRARGAGLGVARAGVAASDPNAPLLDLINTALGGSFTSRLNQNLREDHGWTYGARSSFVETRGVGTFIARAAVFTNVTAPALKEMLNKSSHKCRNHACNAKNIKCYLVLLWTPSISTTF